MIKKMLLVVGLCAAIVPSTLSLNSCAIGALTTEKDAQKLPEPVRGMVLDLMRQEQLMLERCTVASSKLMLATATIAEGCGMEKDAQKFRAQASVMTSASSNEDKKKSVQTGSKLLGAFNAKLASAKNLEIKSRAKFEQGCRDKAAAEVLLNQVATREISQALIKAGALGVHCAKNKDALKSNPLAMIQMGLALNYSLLPIRFVSQDIKKFNEERVVFDEQCQQIGKKYNIPVKRSEKPVVNKIPDLV